MHPTVYTAMGCWRRSPTTYSDGHAMCNPKWTAKGAPIHICHQQTPEAHSWARTTHVGSPAERCSVHRMYEGISRAGHDLLSNAGLRMVDAESAMALAASKCTGECCCKKKPTPTEAAQEQGRHHCNISATTEQDPYCVNVQPHRVKPQSGAPCWAAKPLTDPYDAHPQA
jgi:hypothetical protein